MSAQPQARFCKLCQQHKPWTEQYFNRRNSKRGTLEYSCRDCENARSRERTKEGRPQLQKDRQAARARALTRLSHKFRNEFEELYIEEFAAAVRAHLTEAKVKSSDKYLQSAAERERATSKLWHKGDKLRIKGMPRVVFEFYRYCVSDDGKRWIDVLDEDNVMWAFSPDKIKSGAIDGNDSEGTEGSAGESS